VAGVDDRRIGAIETEQIAVNMEQAYNRIFGGDNKTCPTVFSDIDDESFLHDGKELPQRICVGSNQ